MARILSAISGRSKLSLFSMISDDSSISSSNTFQSASFHYLRIYLNFTYFMFLSPIRILKEDDVYVVKSGIFHKIIATILVYGTTFTALMCLRERSNIEIQPENIHIGSFLFQAAGLIANSAYCIGWIYIFWFKPKDFSRVLDICQDPTATTKPLSWKYTLVTFILCIIGLVQGILCIYSIYQIPDWELLKIQAMRYRYIFYFDSTYIEVDDDGMTWPVLLFISFFMVFETLYVLLVQYVLLFMMMSAITVHHVSQDFLNLLPCSDETDYDDPDSLRTILKHYAKIKELVHRVNEVSGPVLVAFILEAVPYLAENLTSIFGNDRIMSKIKISYFTVYYFSILLIAAEAHMKIKRFREWLFRRGLQLDRKRQNSKFLLAFAEASTSEVGLGGCGFFTISYAFVGSLTSLFITYAIIVAQFKSTPETSGTETFSA